MKSVLFRGIEIEYNEKSLRNYGIQYNIAKGGAAQFSAMDVVFGGKYGDGTSVKVSELFGTPLEELDGSKDDVPETGDILADIFAAILEAEGDDTKN